MDDKTLKHLEFIQNTINRMSTNSFIIKGWAITLVGIILGLNKLEGNYIFKKSFYNFPIEMVIVLLIIFLFWFINAYFLQQERRYIYIYSKTIEPFNPNSPGSNNTLILDMNYKNYDTSPSISSKLYYCISAVSVLCALVSYFFFDQVVFKIIFTVVFVLISLFNITYTLHNKYLCNYWACFMGRTLISVYGTMIVLLLLANHSMFNIESKIKSEKTECECVIKNNSK
ncbi:hypothetical protein DOS84_13135 [Flavobacterium aquariorum]|uniref:Uncharacterized protein n=1 Tax=Flavobacterium aquariorum TaxID=2217670 RepID=A0A2W7VKS1_9FLAO|nr:hypothetical protein [Flavobacterium aquariorum]PZX92812.1 hypothetical protein DOS84_13135 [Flavobacterium aquariorum]